MLQKQIENLEKQLETKKKELCQMHHQQIISREQLQSLMAQIALKTTNIVREELTDFKIGVQQRAEKFETELKEEIRKENAITREEMVDQIEQKATEITKGVAKEITNLRNDSEKEKEKPPKQTMESKEDTTPHDIHVTQATQLSGLYMYM